MHHKLEIFEKDELVDKEKIAYLTDQFSLISWKATGGQNWQEYIPAKEGWAKYYKSEGGRPQDYDRLIILYDAQGKVIHFTGLTILNVGDERIIWVHVTITDPKDQGTGVLNKALIKLFDFEWMRSLCASPKIIFRTPNPIVYNAMRSNVKHLQALHQNLLMDYFPKISDEGDLDPIPSEIQELGKSISKLISPTREFLPDKFIIKGYYKDYGALYSDHKFNSYLSELQNFFRDHLDDENEDGFFILINVTFKS
jgi:hypothetical protein